MRKLQKSLDLGRDEWLWLLTVQCDNTSRNRHRRLLHSLQALTVQNPPGAPRKFVIVARRPNRAARRAAMYANVTPKVVQVEVPAPRKITGAVRRGLERGHQA